MLQVIEYTIAVAVLLGIAGFCVEQALGRWGLPRRLAWGFAMLTSMLFPLLMMSRAQPAPAAAEIIHQVAKPVVRPAVAREFHAEPMSVPATAPASSPPATAERAPVTTPTTLTSPPATMPSPQGLPAPAAKSAARWSPPLPSDRLIVMLWIAASSALLLYMCGTSAVLHRRASRWRRESIMGHEVLVSVDTGPAVLGVLRPDIVMPHWCLDEPIATRMLILQHEQQHVAGRDPLLLWGAVLTVVALPWNLPLWWQLRRLRLAIELDCDARVLSAGADAGSYGEVLLTVTQRGTAGLHGVAIAMAQPVSILERRIHNLTRIPPRHARLWTAGVSLIAVASVSAATMLNAPVMPGMGRGAGSQAAGSPSVAHVQAEVAGSGGAVPAVGAALPMQNSASEEPPAHPLQRVAAAPAAAGATQPLPSSGKPAPNPLECLDQDVLRGLLQRGLSDRSIVVGTQSPPELALFKAPRQLSWVGTGERSLPIATIGAGEQKRSTVAAVYRSTLDPEAARAAAAAALMAGGWMHMQGLSYSPGVFDESISIPDNDTYCRDGNSVSLRASSLDGVTYVVLGVTRGLEGNTSGFISACNQPPRRLADASRNPMDKYLPKFQLPTDPATGKPVSKRGGGNSGNDQKQTFSTTVALNDSLANVARHFARQMTEQGWTADGSFGQAGSTGSTWIKRVDAESAIRGTLVVSDFEQGRFAVIFRAIRTN